MFMHKSVNPMQDQLLYRANMRKRLQNKRLPRMALVLLPGLFYITPAYAYLDPGAGSILLQSLLAGIATAAALGSMFWQRLKGFISSLFFTRKSTDSKSEATADKSR
jgi:hypothetical protein